MFWHQFNRQKLLNPARFIVRDVLRQPRGSRLAQVLTLFATFLLSCILHLSTDASVGVFFHESDAIVFFAMQPLGILLEEGLQALYRSLRRRRRRHNKKFDSDNDNTYHSEGNGVDTEPEARWTRAVGYAWVVLWLGWTAPRCTYPNLSRFEGTPKEVVVPFSFVGLF
jgi:hypothetical protein